MNAVNTVAELLRGAVLRLGVPVTSGPLTLIPVFHSGRSLDYLLFADAVAGGSARVEEADAGDDYRRIQVVNLGPSWVLLVEGQILIGLKQNRALNTSVLIAPGGTTVIPVSCVEEYRWQALAVANLSPEVFASPGVRQVTAAADQTGAWAEIRRRIATTGTSSPSEDYVEVHRTQLHDIQGVLGGIRPNRDQNGVVAVIGGRLAALDLFADARTLERLWEPLVGGYAADALLRPCPYGARPGRRHVQEAIRHLAHAQATVHASPGAGEIVQLSGERGATASALVHDGVVVHVAAHWPSRA